MGVVCCRGGAAVSDLPSRESVGIDLALAAADLRHPDAPLFDILIIATEWAAGRLVDRETMTPMYRQGGMSGAWYRETDGDPPDGWLAIEDAT